MAINRFFAQKSNLKRLSYKVLSILLKSGQDSTNSYGLVILDLVEIRSMHKVKLHIVENLCLLLFIACITLCRSIINSKLIYLVIF